MAYSTINSPTARTLGLVAGLWAGLGVLGAGTTLAQDYDFDWVTIGDPGNRDTRPDEVPMFSDLEVGGVDYEYRIARNELTVQQQFEFVQAYWEYVPTNERYSWTFTGEWIRAAGPRDDPQYYIVNGAERLPGRMSWRYAARFVNWLHNDKVEEQWAFENGAYDTSTFGYNNDGTFTDQAEHNPDAKFWIPTMDEYAKAMFWDPEKNNGEGGYWMFPHSKDVPPISGAPWEGGETNAGAHPDDFPPLDVGSYPWAASPWGLLDGSGGRSEWTEFVPPENRKIRVRHGSIEYGSFYDHFDRLDQWRTGDPRTDSFGLRVASAIPSPASALPVVIGLGLSARRRRY